MASYQGLAYGATRSGPPSRLLEGKDFSTMCGKMDCRKIGS
jgi:hypothetical protein